MEALSVALEGLRERRAEILDIGSGDEADPAMPAASTSSAPAPRKPPPRKAAAAAKQQAKRQCALGADPVGDADTDYEPAARRRRSDDIATLASPSHSAVRVGLAQANIDLRSYVRDSIENIQSVTQIELATNRVHREESYRFFRENDDQFNTHEHRFEVIEAAALAAEQRLVAVETRLADAEARLATTLASQRQADLNFQAAETALDNTACWAQGRIDTLHQALTLHDAPAPPPPYPPSLLPSRPAHSTTPRRPLLVPRTPTSRTRARSKSVPPTSPPRPVFPGRALPPSPLVAPVPLSVLSRCNDGPRSLTPQV